MIMSNIVAENLVTVAVPGADWFVVDHHKGARAAIAFGCRLVE
jgi:hypothetical protein